MQDSTDYKTIEPMQNNALLDRDNLAQCINSKLKIFVTTEGRIDYLALVEIG